MLCYRFMSDQSRGPPKWKGQYTSFLSVEHLLKKLLKQWNSLKACSNIQWYKILHLYCNQYYIYIYIFFEIFVRSARSISIFFHAQLPIFDHFLGGRDLWIIHLTILWYRSWLIRIRIKDFIIQNYKWIVFHPQEHTKELESLLFHLM